MTDIWLENPMAKPAKKEQSEALPVADEGLTEDIKDTIRTVMTNIAAALPGYRSRLPQRVMIAEAAKTLAGEYGGKRIFVCEAKTGTGKSIGYMAGAIPVALAQGKHVVISTATVTLQEQITNRDLPQFQKASGLNFTFAMAKGRRRYVCPRNLGLLTGSVSGQENLGFGDDVSEGAAWTRPPEPSEVNALRAMEVALKQGQWVGDIDIWPQSLKDDLQDMITTTNHGCTRKHCAHYQKCPFFEARRGLKQKDVIIANHDLVLADIDLDGGAILPPPDECIYVFDEGHHLAPKAVQRFGSTASLRGAIGWLEKAPKTVAHLIPHLPADPALQTRAAEMARDVHKVRGRLEEAHRLIAASFPAAEPGPYGSDTDLWRFPQGQVPADLVPVAKQLADSALSTYRHVAWFKEKLMDAVDDGLVRSGVAERIAPDIGFLEHRLENLARLWWLMSKEDKGNAPPTARWVTRAKKSRDQDFVVSASPVTAAAFLQRGLWADCAGAVITSATLTALGKYDRLRLGTGLRDDDGSRFIVLDSPFDYQTNAVLHIPAMRTTPKAPAGHTDEVAGLIPQLIDPAQGTLVLFASGKQMRAVAEQLPTELRDITLIQGDCPKQDILDRHTDAVTNSRGSVIFGLASFAEGVDLPGQLCEHVIIPKLPFAVPDSPVEATYSEWLEARGRNPFMEVTVPDAVLRLVQACGRLIRTETDTGRITILDRRLVSTKYGKQMLESLPPFRREID